MYRERLWTMRQYAGMGTAEETNARFKRLLANGQTGLSTAFDLPTQMGLDSDDTRARGEVGQVGVAIDSIEDMERLFAGIPLDRVSTSMTINAPAAVLVAMYVAVAQGQGQVGGLGSDVEASGEAQARQRLLFPKPLPQQAQHRHLLKSPLDPKLPLGVVFLVARPSGEIARFEYSLAAAGRASTRPLRSTHTSRRSHRRTLPGTYTRTPESETA
jgi:hypothetical protein